MAQMNCKACTHNSQHFGSGSKADKTPKGFLTWSLYMGMVKDLIYSVCQFGFFPKAIIDVGLKKHMSQFCALYDSAITFKHNEGTPKYNEAKKILKSIDEASVLKISKNQKFRNSTSGVNVMNPNPSHECKPSFHDIMLICYKCYLTAVLLIDDNEGNGVATLTERAYIGNTSANKIDDRVNLKMFGAGRENNLKDFERKNQSFVSRYQELVDKAVGGLRRTTLNTTTINTEIRESWASESERISDMMSDTDFNLDVEIDDDDDTSSIHATKKKGKTSKKEKRVDEASRIAGIVLAVFPDIMKNNEVKENDSIAVYYKDHVMPLLNTLKNIDEDAASSSDDEAASVEGDDDDECERLVEKYSPSKIGSSQTIAERKTIMARSCTGRADSALIKEFLNVLKTVFDENNYMVLRENIRDVGIAFDFNEAAYVNRAWNHGNSVHDSLNEIVSKMEKSGWLRTVKKDEFIFSKPTPNEENTTLTDLVANQPLPGNDTVRKDLSANDCDTNESDILKVDIEGKTEEDPSVDEDDSKSKRSKLNFDENDTDEDVDASSEGNEKKNGTEEELEVEQTAKDCVEGGGDKLFADSSSDSDGSVVNTSTTNKGETDKASGKKRILDSDDDSDEDVKKQKYDKVE